MTEKEELKLYRKMFMHAAEHYPGVYFICGEGGEKDERGLPENILICPSNGLTEQKLYKRIDNENDCGGRSSRPD